MANRTVKDAQTIKGTNPQYLVEKIIRTRIYDCKYWKEECFALTAELLVDKAMELRYVAGTHAGNIKPSPFLCLTLKMLQIQPQKDIVIEFIKNEDFKYVRALGAFYLRLTGTAVDCYKYLEPLFNDYRKIRLQRRDGKFELSHMDEFVDSLLREERLLDVILPRIQKRDVLEECNDLEPRVSVLEDDLDEEAEEAESSDEEEQAKSSTAAALSSSSSRRHRDDDHHRRDRERDRDRDRRRDRDRDSRRERSSSRDRASRRRRSRSRSPRSSRRREERRERDRGDRSNRDREHERRRGDRDRAGDRDRDRGAGSKDSMSVEETNKLRASLGLAPLK